MQLTVSEERAESSTNDSLPKRDLFLLPLIGLLTMVLLVGAAEWLARLFWVQQTDDACQYYDQRDVRHKPFCTSSMKNLEGPWVRYEYNACGYRGKEPCGPKPADTARFAIMGTSFAFGLYVPENDLFYVRARPAVQHLLGRRVEFENLGALGPDLPLQYRMIDEISRLRPDGVFFIVCPFDLKRLDDQPLWVEQRNEIRKRGFFNLSDLAYFGRSSRAFFVAQHALLSDPDFVVRAFRMKGDPDDAAHVPASPVAEKRFQRLEVLMQRLAAGFQSRGIPFYVIPLPNRLQAALIGRKVAIPGVDPLAFSRRVAEIAQKVGARCIDTTRQLQHTVEPERAFYPVDGHLNALGNKIVADAMVDYFSKHSGLAASLPATPRGSGN